MMKLLNKRLVQWLLLPLLVLLIVVGLLGTWVYYTESGLRWSLKQLDSLVPTQLALSQANGSLSSQIEFERIIWQQPNAKLIAEKLVLQCRWFALLSKELDCQKSNLSKLSFKMLATENNQQSNDQSFVQYLQQPITDIINPSLIAQVKLPISIRLEKTQIGLILIEQSIPSEASLEITDFSLNKLKLQQDSVDSVNPSNSQSLALSFTKLALSHQAHQLTSQLNWRSESTWPYELQLAVSGEKIDTQFNSKGSFFSDSKFQLTTRLPIKSSHNGQWNWNERLTIQSTSKVQKQTLTIIENPPTINSALFELELSWPKADLNYQSNFDWLDFKNLNLFGNSNSRDITNWQTATQLQAKLIGNIKQSQWHSLKSSTSKLIENDALSAETLVQNLEKANKTNLIANSNSPQTEKTLPIQLELFAKSEDSLLTLSADNFSLAKLTGSFNFSGIIVDQSVPEYQLKANLNAPDFEFSEQRYTGVDTKLSLEQRANRLFIESTGSIANLHKQSMEVAKINWEIKLAEKWIGKVSAAKIKIDEYIFNNISFKLDGDEKNHSINGGFSLNNYRPIALSLNANLKIKQAENKNSETTWHINRAVATTATENFVSDTGKIQTLKFNANNIVITANKQSVENLCIEDFGKACLQANLEKDNLSAQLKLINFKLRPVTNLPMLEPLKGLSGELNGSLKLVAIKSKIKTLIIDVTAPHLSFSQEQWQVGLSDFTVSNTNPNGTNILSNWQLLAASYKTPQWLSEISAKKGHAQFDLDQLDTMRFSLSQQSAFWTLPQTIISDEDVDQINISKKSLAINNINFSGELTTEKLINQLNIELSKDDFINASSQIQLPLTNDSSIQSEITLKIAELDWLKQWQSRIDQLSGSWTHQLKISGTRTKPQLNGQGELNIARLTMEELGIDIKDSRINMHSDNVETKLNGVLKNNQGELNLNGKATLTPDLNASLNLDGEKITLIDSKEYKMVVSPQLKATINKSHLEVTGNVDINEAKVTISQLPAKTVRVSDDEIIINRKLSQEEPFTYNIAIKVNAKNNVSVKGFGLSSEVVGKLEAKAQTGKPLEVNGQMLLENGQFEAYKQVLTIEQGQLLFLGNPENPGIQFRASRKIEDTLVGVIASGSLANPSLRLYSQPAMADEEVLALLLTGRSLKSLSQQEGNALANAAISLGVSEANKLAAKIADTLGIKNINITTKTKADSTRVDIGTQVNDRLSVGFGTNIDSTNQLNSGWIIEYRLSPSISFEAISGEEVSANITYKKQFQSDDKKD